MPRDRYEWRDEYALGVPSIDAQHRQLFDYFSEARGLSAAGDEAGLRRLLDRLLTYTVEHFAHEEALHEAAGYPNRGPHAQEHDRIQARVVALLARAEVSAVEILDFLGEWLVHHVVHSDRHAARYLKPEG